MCPADSTSSPARFVDLDRRFKLLPERIVNGAEELDSIYGHGNELTWNDVLKRRRVVILAEAGSGKTRELEEKANQLRQSGKPGFFATVEEVGKSGRLVALSADRAYFDAWKASEDDAWFFIDSIDEAKKARIRLKVAVQAVAEEIRGCEGRAHIVLSGRHSDWDFRSDLVLVEELLAVPEESMAVPIAPVTLAAQIAHVADEEEKTPQSEQEKPTVLVLLSLDEARVRLFAASQGIGQVDDFLSQLHENDLMRLASRPLDLKWMVGYWQKETRFGRLVEMLELSIQMRAAEQRKGKPAHAPLPLDRASAALRRIGAALVLQKTNNVLIPDDQLVFANHPHSGLVLADVATDLTGDEAAELLSRAIFVPVSGGIARFAQDNKGEVRSLLAARWLHDRVEENCPKSAIRNLIFATIYGEEVVIPSMQQPAAWLSIWDPEIGRELARRDPAILVQLGDPASLPVAIAQLALRVLIEKLASIDRDRLGDEDQIRRLVKPDFAPLIRELWKQHRKASAARSFLIKCILYGRMTSLSDIALEAATEFVDDSLASVFGGRAVLELAQANVDQYLDFVRRDYQKLDAIMVWEVAEAHYPGKLTASDIAAFTDTLDEPSAEMYFERFLKSLDSKVVPLTDLLEVLERLLKRAPLMADEETWHTKDDDLRALAALCSTLYSKLGSSCVPPLLSRGYLVASKYEGRRIEETLRRAANESAVRRRALFWAAADEVANDPTRKGQRAEDLWGFRRLQYLPPLPPEDLDWLLEDALDRRDPSDRKLAASGAMRLVASASNDERLLAQLRAAAPSVPEIADQLERWERPHVKTAEEMETDAEIARLDQRNREARAENDQGWQDFIQQIRASPEQLRDVAPLHENGSMDARVYNLWALLSRSRKHRDHYAINSLEPLQPLVGDKAANYFRVAIGKFWRRWDPKAKGVKAPSERNSINHFDLIGLAGVALEASYVPGWASKLTNSEAHRAALYATLELNGFPRWIDDLASRWPEAVRKVLEQELRAEVLAQPPHEHLSVLQDVSHASEAIQRICAETLYQLLVQPPEIPLKARIKALEILGPLKHKSVELGNVLLQRSTTVNDVHVLAADLGGAFRLKPEQAVGALKNALARVPDNVRDELVISVLIDVAGDGWTKSDIPDRLPFDSLTELMKIAFKHVWGHESLRSTRVTFRKAGPSHHDAEQARNALVDALMRHSGLATYKMIKALPRFEHSPIDDSRARVLARERAERDAEFEAWRAGDLARFERDFKPTPRSSQDLCRLALAILENVQDDVLRADFQQGRILVGLKDEELVQNWVANSLQVRGTKRFSVERESHVAHEKEPDLRLRVSASQATTPIEIKVVESWTLPELERALIQQLIGQYLLDISHRWGILLLVHQKPRPRGWTRSGKKLSITSLVRHLQCLADKIAAKEPAAPQATVALIDVSALYLPSKSSRQKHRRLRGAKRRKTRAGAKATRKKGR
jgi:hypothetical protein